MKVIQFTSRQSPYQAGDVAGFPDHIAERYVADGLAEPVDKEPEASEVEVEEEVSADDLNRVVAEIGRLNPEDPAHWTKVGLPQCDALTDRLGFRVTTLLRDRAWAIYDPEPNEPVAETRREFL